MEIVELNKYGEPFLWEYIQKNIADFHHLISNYKREPAIVKVFLAINNASEIEGVLTLFYELFAEIRGSEDATAELINVLPKNVKVINVYEDFKHYVINKYPKYKTEKIDLLLLCENIYNKLEVKIIPELLNEKNIEEICNILRVSDPEEWGLLEPEDIPMQKNWRWYGFKLNEKIISIGSISMSDISGTITYIATYPKYRNLGYATSMVSFLLNEILRKTNLALINARFENKTSMNIYQKAGFKPYRKFFWIEL